MEEIRLRNALLALHGSLLEHERRAYEKANGRVSGAEFLQALLADPSLGWIGRLTALVASFDEAADQPAAASQVRRLRARRLLCEESDFHAKCLDRIQASPDVAFAHAKAAHLIR